MEITDSDDEFCNEMYDAFLEDTWYDALLDTEFSQQGSGVQSDLLEGRLVITPNGSRKSPKYGYKFDRYTITLADVDQVALSETPHFVHALLDKIIRDVTKDNLPHHKVRISIESDSLRYPIWTPPMNCSQLTVARWMAEVERVLNSNEHLRLNNKFKVQVQTAAIASGAAKQNVPRMVLSKLQNKRSVVQIRNENDQMCLARCFVLAHALAVGGAKSPAYQQIRDNRATQRNKAMDLLKKLGLGDREMTIDDLPTFAKAFPDCRVRVFSLDQANAIIWDNRLTVQREINLLHHSRHFAVLTTVKGFFKNSYYCTKCNVGYDRRTAHRCSLVCSLCYRPGCVSDGAPKVACKDCNRSFHSRSCFDHHKLGPGNTAMDRKRVPICNQIRVCTDCRFHYRPIRPPTDAPHRCGEVSDSHVQLFRNTAHLDNLS